MEAVFEVNECVRGLQSSAQLYASDQFSRPVQEHFQYLEGLTRQAQAPPLLPQLLSLEVRFEWTEAGNGSGMWISRHSGT